MTSPETKNNVVTVLNKFKLTFFLKWTKNMDFYYLTVTWINGLKMQQYLFNVNI